MRRRALQRPKDPRGQRATRRLWLLALLVLALTAVYLPAEAFDGDADLGFDEALLESLGPARSLSPAPPRPFSPPGVHDPSNFVFHEPASLGGAHAGPHADAGPLACLRASRLCARSRIAKACSCCDIHVYPSQPPERTRPFHGPHPYERGVCFFPQGGTA